MTETRTTSGGRATASLVYASGDSPTAPPLDGQVTARVGSGSASTQVHFRGYSAAQMAILSVLPNRGKPQGGDQVTISGQGFVTPLAVNFIVSGTSYPATVTAVAADGSSITALTPQVPTSSGDQLASVQVTLTGVVSPGGGPASATLANAFTYSSASDTGIPQLFSVVPNSGSANGGDIIILTGKYFTEPLQVSFVLPAATVPGQVAAVQHGADGIDVAQVVTPKVTISAQTLANLAITNMAGTASSKTATFNQVFAFTLPVTGPPVIYYISPAYGSVVGNDTVTIYGANFGSNFGAPPTVTIGPTSEIVESVSGDGASITILTRPVAGAVPTTAQDVTVTTALGTVTLPAAFTYLEGQTPTLYVLTPNIGPLEGGTRVTITGAGFQYPVQVLFGTQQAQVVSNNFNQVVCISPSITASKPTTPTTVSVTVTNTGTGKVSNAMPFTYGQAMFISGISPLQGPAGTSVTITGQGFVSPVSVIWGSGTSWSVLSVAGTQVVAQAVLPPGQCSGGSGTVKVTNLDSGLSAVSTDSFTYSSAIPLVASVRIDGGGNTVTQYAPPNCTTAWSSHTITIKGSGFQGPTANVNIGPVGPLVGTVVDATTITLSALPDLTAVTLNQITCSTGGGVCGQQSVPTPVSVTVTNPTTGCSNTLANAIIINPCDTSCHASLNSLTFNPAPGTTQTSGVSFQLSLAFTPSPSTSPVTVTLSYIGFSGSPGSALIPAGAASPVIVPVTLTNTGGTAVTGNITATAGGGGSCAPITVTSAPITVLPTVTLAVTLAGNAAGNSVSSSPIGISCLGTCSSTFALNTSVQLNAVADIAVTYSGDCSNLSPLASNPLVMNASKNCTVTFHAPTITSVAPATGPAAGGTAVTITGTGFANGAKVTFGGTAATAVMVVNSTSITCTTPAGTVGAQNVVVTNSDGQKGTLAAGFTYI